jgi:hypothetical protein
MPDIHFYVTKPPEKDVPAFEGLADVVKKLEHVSEATADPTTSVVAVTFAGGRGEQQEIERAIKGAGYVVSRRSVRSDPLGARTKTTRRESRVLWGWVPYRGSGPFLFPGAVRTIRHSPTSGTCAREYYEGSASFHLLAPRL